MYGIITQSPIGKIIVNAAIKRIFASIDSLSDNQASCSVLLEQLPTFQANQMKPREIKSLRTSLDFSQPKFVEVLGIRVASPDAARQMVSRWERGTRNPSAAAAALLKKCRDEMVFKRSEKRVSYNRISTPADR